MRRHWPRIAMASAVLGVLAGARGSAAQAAIDVPSIAVERSTLANGLTVLLSEDHTAPVVHVSLWYHVGSKNESAGRTGFAHLFEHMMFQGSEHVPKGGYFKAMEDAGADFNGETAEDRTRYYATLPINYLETMLWLESDRMGHFLPALDQEKLDNQRDVVKNERRQSVDNQPYGSGDEVLRAALYPASNPYSWPVIGSMTDLSAASLDDVKAFFRRFYVPNNAALVICGDIDIAKTKAMVERYFGNIPAGGTVERPVVPAVALAGEKRLVLEDVKVTEPQLVMAWPGVGVHSSDVAALDALANVLTADRTSRLTKLLVYDRRLASRVVAFSENSEDAGEIQVRVSPLPGASMTDIERLVDSVVDGVKATPLEERDVQRATRRALVGTVLAMQSVETKAHRLVSGLVYFGDPLRYKTELEAIRAVRAADVQRVARQCLGQGRVVLSMVPKGKLDLVSQPTAAYVNVTPRPESGQ